MNTLKNLKKLVGDEFDCNEVICCFDDTDSEVIVSESSNYGYDYIAYENFSLAPVYLFKVDGDGTIMEVWEG